MGFKSSVDELEEFLARQLPWVRGILRGEFNSLEVLTALQEPGGIEILGKAQDDYLELLTRCPTRLREYRKREAESAAEIALSRLPSMPLGRPRKDSLAQEAMELKRGGVSYGKIALRLNSKYGDGTTTAQAVRKLIVRQRRTAPEKT